MSVIVKRVDRPPREVVEGFKNLSVSTVHEAMGKETANVMDPGIKPIAPGMKVAGSALTVLCFPADNITVHKALTLAQAGDILVVAGHGIASAMWGGQFTFQAKHRGVAGVVVDGSVRDVGEIRAVNFPCFARIVSPMGSAKETPGSINVPIQCGGVIVRPGDIILGDDDGVVALPKERAAEVLQKAKERKDREEAMKQMFQQGKTSFEIYGFEKIFQQKGVKEV